MYKITWDIAERYVQEINGRLNIHADRHGNVIELQQCIDDLYLVKTLVMFFRIDQIHIRYYYRKWYEKTIQYSESIENIMDFVKDFINLGTNVSNEFVRCWTKI